MESAGTGQGSAEPGQEDDVPTNQRLPLLGHNLAPLSLRGRRAVRIKVGRKRQPAVASSARLDATESESGPISESNCSPQENHDTEDTKPPMVSTSVPVGPTNKAISNLCRPAKKSDATNLSPMWVLHNELWKEFRLHRLWLNHVEAIDFAIFEYGQRRKYLHWRTFSFCATLALTIYIFLSRPPPRAVGAPYSNLIYMHVWTAVLLLAYNLFEILVLTVTLIYVPTRLLVRLHHTPWYFKVTWFLHNITHANIMSCNIMYFFGLRDIDHHIGHMGICHAFLTSFVGVHVSLTAMPSRLLHFFHPMTFNLLHIVFTFYYPAMGGTNALGEEFVYRELDWSNHSTTALCNATVWLLLTLLSHGTIVFCCWCRRAVYRWRRNKVTIPVYGVSAVEFCPLAWDIGLVDESGLSCNLKDELTDATVESGQAFVDIKSYSPHMSYHERKRRKAQRDVDRVRDASSPPPPQIGADTDKDTDPLRSRSSQAKASTSTTAKGHVQAGDKPAGKVKKDGERRLTKFKQVNVKGRKRTGAKRRKKHALRAGGKAGGDEAAEGPGGLKREETESVPTSQPPKKNAKSAEEGTDGDGLGVTERNTGPGDGSESVADRDSRGGGLECDVCPKEIRAVCLSNAETTASSEMATGSPLGDGSREVTALLEPRSLSESTPTLDKSEETPSWEASESAHDSAVIASQTVGRADDGSSASLTDQSELDSRDCEPTES